MVNGAATVPSNRLWAQWQGYFNYNTVQYNGRIAPIIPYGIKGVIWYQGENNAGKAYQYRALFPMMIEDWRIRWGNGYMPFLFVQLANYKAKKAEPSKRFNWAELREAQALTPQGFRIPEWHAPSILARQTTYTRKINLMWANASTWQPVKLPYHEDVVFFRSLFMNQ